MPSLLDYPAYPLLFGPSPVHPLERLTADLGGGHLVLANGNVDVAELRS